MIVHELAQKSMCWPIDNRHPVVILRDEAEREYFAKSGGAPEFALIRWALQFLPSAGHTFLDVGAHVGTWSLLFAQQCRHVHAFEPQRSTFHRLCGGIALSGAQNVTAHRLALSDSPSTNETLYHVSQDGGGSHLGHLPSSAPPPISGETVEVETLDNMRRRLTLQDVGFIKIDAEGFEERVLRGAKHSLHAWGYPKILLECWTHDWFAGQRVNLLQHAHAIGYRVIPVGGWPEMLLLERGGK